MIAGWLIYFSDNAAIVAWKGPSIKRLTQHCGTESLPTSKLTSCSMPIKIKSPRSENLKIIQRCILGCSKCRRERERANFINTFKSTIPDTKYIYCTIFPPRTVVHLNNIHIKRPRTLVFNENCYSILRTVSYYRGGGSVAERQVLQQEGMDWWPGSVFPQLQLTGTCNGAVSSLRPAPHAIHCLGPQLLTIGLRPDIRSLF